jgi:hypothetical protein
VRGEEAAANLAEELATTQNKTKCSCIFFIGEREILATQLSLNGQNNYHTTFSFTSYSLQRH